MSEDPVTITTPQGERLIRPEDADAYNRAIAGLTDDDAARYREAAAEDARAAARREVLAGKVNKILDDAADALLADQGIV